MRLRRRRARSESGAASISGAPCPGNVPRVRGRAGHTGETKCAVVGYHDGPSFLAELDESSIAQRWPRLIEGIELLEDQQSHRLTHIQRRLADRAEQVAGVEFRNAGADFVEIGGAHHHRGLERAGQTREVHAGVDVCRVRRPDEHGVRSIRRPAREIGGAKIGCVEFCAGDFGDTVDAAGAVRGRIPVLSSRQSLPRSESGFLS